MGCPAWGNTSIPELWAPALMPCPSYTDSRLASLALDADTYVPDHVFLDVLHSSIAAMWPLNVSVQLNKITKKAFSLVNDVSRKLHECSQYHPLMYSSMVHGHVEIWQHQLTKSLSNEEGDVL